MNAKQKAEDLFYKFLDSHISTVPMSKDEAKNMAALCIDEVINANPYYFYPNRKVVNYKEHSTIDFWKEVKKEVENL